MRSMLIPIILISGILSLLFPLWDRKSNTPTQKRGIVTAYVPFRFTDTYAPYESVLCVSNRNGILYPPLLEPVPTP